MSIGMFFALLAAIYVAPTLTKEIGTTLSGLCLVLSIVAAIFARKD